MEVYSVKKSGNTRVFYNEFVYTWTIENYIRFKGETENVELISPTIPVYNGNDKYEFLLRISTYYNGAFMLQLEVFSCPKFSTKAHIRLSIVLRNEDDYRAVESVTTIIRKEKIPYIHIKNGEIFGTSLCDGNLTIRCKIFFRNGHSHIEVKNADLEATKAQAKMLILDELEKLLDSGKFSDVTLIVGGKKYLAHKAILASGSPVFSAMFEHEMLENKKNTVEITDVEPEIMAEILRFIYSGKVKNIKTSTSDLLSAADKYQLDALRLVIEEVLIEKIDLDSLEEILKLVDKYEMCSRLRKAVLKYLSFNVKAVANWGDFDRVMKSLSASLMFDTTKAMVSKI